MTELCTYWMYVESTTEAVTFYDKHVLKSGLRIVIDLRAKSNDADEVLYEEVGCVYKSKGIRIA